MFMLITAHLEREGDGGAADAGQRARYQRHALRHALLPGAGLVVLADAVVHAQVDRRVRNHPHQTRLHALEEGPRPCATRRRFVRRLGLVTYKICFTGINWKIVSTYEPKIMLTNSPA
eukprot:1177003-Prorocentrum_minimum.AAC.4